METFGKENFEYVQIFKKDLSCMLKFADEEDNIRKRAGIYDFDISTRELIRNDLLLYSLNIISKDELLDYSKLDLINALLDMDIDEEDAQDWYNTDIDFIFKNPSSTMRIAHIEQINGFVDGHEDYKFSENIFYLFFYIGKILFSYELENDDDKNYMIEKFLEIIASNINSYLDKEIIIDEKIKSGTLNTMESNFSKSLDGLSGIEFENLIHELLVKMGFEVETTKVTGDGGIDLVAYNKQPILKGKYVIQCKRWKSTVGEPVLRDLYGAVTHERASKGILVTTGKFTKNAIDFSEGKPLELIDNDEIRRLLEEYSVFIMDKNSGLNESHFEQRITKTHQDYFNNGYAKCIYVKASDEDDKLWALSKVWGKIYVSDTIFGFEPDEADVSKGLYEFSGSQLWNVRFSGVLQTPQASEFIPGYKMLGESSRLLKVTLYHIDVTKEFIVEANYDVCDKIVKMISYYITSRGSASDNSGIGNSNCFVATVVYESNECRQVNQLRMWRDSYLSKRLLGKAFIKIYYKHGEKFSLVVNRKPILKNLIRSFLDSFVSWLE
ncbi:MAG: restriction endonuclease [Clostridiales bacterium]|nr:restriction endonuclease [Clostridiales bacterium]